MAWGPHGIFGMFLYILGLVMNVVGYATPSWYKLTIYDEQLSYGLFRVCVSRDSMENCNDISDVEDDVTGWQIAGQELSSIGLVLMVIGEVVVIYGAAKCKSPVGGVGACLAIYGVLKGAAGGIAVVAKSRDRPTFTSTGWSATVYLVGALLVISGVIIQFFELTRFRPLSYDRVPLLRT